MGAVEFGALKYWLPQSLVLLNEASSTSTDNSSGNEETKEHSSHVAGLDKNKKEKKKKGMKIMGGPEIVVGENRVLEGGASSSVLLHVILSLMKEMEAQKRKEHDLGAKNRKQKEKKKKKNGKNNMESDDEANELTGKHDFHSLILVGLESESTTATVIIWSDPSSTGQGQKSGSVCMLEMM
ncbi:hypothetical protein NC651_019283 [Populus alba x Populus x berolinensis]|nr:hypothetical protein NC651_019283 [Populus alba x Populus x berolinensis]